MTAEYVVPRPLPKFCFTFRWKPLYFPTIPKNIFYSTKTASKNLAFIRLPSIHISDCNKRNWSTDHMNFEVLSQNIKYMYLILENQEKKQFQILG